VPNDTGMWRRIAGWFVANAEHVTVRSTGRSSLRETTVSSPSAILPAMAAAVASGGPIRDASPATRSTAVPSGRLAGPRTALPRSRRCRR
jgi:hypothetical protein